MSVDMGAGYSKNLNPDINRGVGHVLSQQDDL